MGKTGCGKPKKSKPAPKKDNCGCPSGNKRRRRRRNETYATYIYRVLRQVHPDTGISRMGMNAMNSFVKDLFEKITNDAAHLVVKVAKKSTMSEREIQTAVRLLLPGELARHAVSEGAKAVTSFNGGKKGKGCKK